MGTIPAIGEVRSGVEDERTEFEEVARKSREHTDLLALSRTITDAQVVVARQEYEQSLDAIIADSKVREIQLVDEGLTVGEEERRRLRRLITKASVITGSIALVVGGVIGVAFNQQATSFVAAIAPETEPTAPSAVPFITGPNDEIVQVTNAWKDEACGTALTLGVIGPNSASPEPFDLTMMSYTVNGTPAVLAEPDSECWFETTIHEGIASNYLIYLDGADAPVESVGVTYGLQVLVWAPEEVRRGGVDSEPAPTLSGSDPDPSHE